MSDHATRTETDSFGPIEVPADHYWGAQTERSRHNFRIGIGDKLLVGELAVDTLDVGIGLGDFLVEPRPLGREIDDALQRECSDLAADQQLHGAFRCAIRE